MSQREEVRTSPQRTVAQCTCPAHRVHAKVQQQQLAMPALVMPALAVRPR